MRNAVEMSSAEMAVYAGAILLGATATACDREPAGTKQRFECHCAFLTDTDGESDLRASVCAPSAEEASQRASGCAQRAAPAPIQSCTCTAAQGACPPDDCEPHEHR